MTDAAYAPDVDRAPQPPTMRACLSVFARIGLLGFGGPAGQIALMHHELVARRGWLDEARFLHALQFCMLLPGPEAQQLATYAGFLLHRVPGALAAGILFVLPGALVMLGLSALYATHGHEPLVAALFFGLKPAVLALVGEALVKVARRALLRTSDRVLAALALFASAALGVPFPCIVIGAGLVGVLRPGDAPSAPGARRGPSVASSAVDALAAAGRLTHCAPRAGRAFVTVVAGVALWLAPLALVALAAGRGAVLVEIGALFAGTSVVTFGGAYAVLGFVAERAVSDYGWLTPGEMLDGLGLAESTPGPLVLVLEYVGFLAAYRAPGALHPLPAGVLGALLTLWVTFAPSFVWIVAFAPYMEALRGYAPLRGALSAISAAVVSVIAQLALWFAGSVLFARSTQWEIGQIHIRVPELGSFVPAAAVLALIAGVCLVRLRLGAPRTLALVALLGAIWALFAESSIGSAWSAHAVFRGARPASA